MLLLLLLAALPSNLLLPMLLRHTSVDPCHCCWSLLPALKG